MQSTRKQRNLHQVHHKEGHQRVSQSETKERRSGSTGSEANHLRLSKDLASQESAKSSRRTLKCLCWLKTTRRTSGIAWCLSCPPTGRDQHCGTMVIISAPRKTTYYSIRRKHIPICFDSPMSDEVRNRGKPCGRRDRFVDMVVVDTIYLLGLK